MGRSPLAILTAMAGAVFAGAGLFARLMNYEMRRDEQLYVPPATLLDGQRLYHDFFYNHVPGSAWLYHAMHEIFGAGGLLFSARLTTFFIWILFAALVAYLTWRLTRSAITAATAVTLLAANDFLLGVVGATATNNFIPLPFVYAGLCLFALGIRGEGIMKSTPLRNGPRPITLFASGVSLAIALSIKVSAVAFIVPVAAAALILPGSVAFATRLKTVFLPFALGGLIGAAPVLFEFLRSPELFLAHVTQYHTGPHVAYWSGETAGDDDVAIGLGAKALLAHQIWFGGVNLLLALGALVALAANALNWRQVHRIDELSLLAIAVIVTVALFGFAPTPSFPQYFAPLSAALLFLIAVAAPPEQLKRVPALEIFFAAIAVLAAVVGAPRLAQHSVRLASPASWTVTRVHEAGEQIAAEMARAGVEGKVLTLLPIYPLEGGLDVYPEFATGQFVYRTADLTPPGLLKWYRTTAPSKIAAFLSADPPAAILLGFEPALEAPMAEFARLRGYQRVDDFVVKDRYGQGYLMIRTDPP